MTRSAHKSQVISPFLMCVSLVLNAQGAQGQQLIQRVDVAPRNVCPMQEVSVDVEAQDSSIPPAPLAIVVNGVPGKTHFLRFSGRPGERRIHVSVATEDGRHESGLFPVFVRDCDPVPSFDLRVRFNPYRPYAADFTAYIDPNLLGSPPEYLWDFGDGTTARTNNPYVSHSYEQSLNGAAPYHNFTVSVSNGLETIATRHVIAVADTYNYNVRADRIQPLVTQDSAFEIHDNYLIGHYTLRNPHVGIDLNQAIIEYKPCDLDAVSSYRRASVEDVIVIKEDETPVRIVGGAIRISGEGFSMGGAIAVKRSDVPPEVCQIAYHLLA